MIIKFKISPNSHTNTWVGWFGENVIKVRLNTSEQEKVEQLLNFITTDLGIKKEDMQVLEEKNSKFVTVEFPDVAWELFLSIIEG